MVSASKATTRAQQHDPALQVALCKSEGKQVILIRSASIRVEVLDAGEHPALKKHQTVLLCKAPDMEPTLRHSVDRVEEIAVSHIGLRQSIYDLLATLKDQQGDLRRTLEQFGRDKKSDRDRDATNLRWLKESVQAQLSAMRAESARMQQALRDQHDAIGDLLTQVQETESDQRRAVQALARTVRSALNEVPSKFADAQAAHARLDIELRRVLHDFDVEDGLRTAVEALLDNQLEALRMERSGTDEEPAFFSTITESRV